MQSKAHPKKSVFMTDTVEFLGFDVSRHGLTPAQAKIKAFLELRYPANVEETMCVMGKLRYYGCFYCFCEHFSSMAEPIQRLLQKGALFNFGAEQRAAMDSIRHEICLLACVKLIGYLQQLHRSLPPLYIL